MGGSLPSDARHLGPFVDIQCSFLLMLSIGYTRWVPAITSFPFQFSILNLCAYPLSPDVAMPSVN